MTELRGRRAGILCAGSIIVDVGKVIDGYPAREHLASISEISMGTGGPALNMAIDVRMLGAAWPVGVAGTIGNDDFGALVRAECARLDIDTSDVNTIEGVATSFTDAMVEAEGGRRTFFHHSGANARYDAALTPIEASTARILHVGAPGIHHQMDTSSGDGNGWSSLLQRARASGLRTNMELVSIDPARIAELARPCLPHLDTIIINDVEASAITGLPAPAREPDWEMLDRAAVALVDAGVSQLAVVHFPAGCVAASPGGRILRQGAVRVPADQIRSTTGAGDAFASGVLFAVHDEWPVDRALRLGVAAAAMSLRSAFTSAGIGTAFECLEMAERDGFLDVAETT